MNEWASGNEHFMVSFEQNGVLRVRDVNRVRNEGVRKKASSEPLL